MQQPASWGGGLLSSEQDSNVMERLKELQDRDAGMQSLAHF